MEQTGFVALVFTKNRSRSQWRRAGAPGRPPWWTASRPRRGGVSIILRLENGVAEYYGTFTRGSHRALTKRDRLALAVSCGGPFLIPVGPIEVL